MPTTGFLLPEVDDESAPFFEGCATGELRVQRCGACERLRFPPRPMCPWCQSLGHAWEALSGRGTVWSVAIPYPPLLPAYAEVAPYNVVIVAVDEDPSIRFVGNVVHEPGASLDSVDPHSIEIGAPVAVVFETLHDDEGDVTLPRWVLA